MAENTPEADQPRRLPWRIRLALGGAVVGVALLGAGYGGEAVADRAAHRLEVAKSADPTATLPNEGPFGLTDAGHILDYREAAIGDEEIGKEILAADTAAFLGVAAVGWLVSYFARRPEDAGE